MPAMTTLFWLCHDFCATCRKVTEHVINLPVNIHCFLLPLLAVCWKYASIQLVLVTPAILHVRCNLSVQQQCCFHVRSMDALSIFFVLQLINLSNDRFFNYWNNLVDNTMKQTASLLVKIPMLCNGSFMFSNQHCS